MPKPPIKNRLTAGEQRLAGLIAPPATPNSARGMDDPGARPQVDLIWDADRDRHEQAD